MTQPFSFSIILLAGGKGQRLPSQIPKQFLLIQKKPVVFYSLEVFLDLPFKEICIVCEQEYQGLFSSFGSIIFASPGNTRQTSMENGFKALSKPCDVVLIHDSARPFIDREITLEVLRQAFIHHAAASAVRATSTFKLAGKDHLATSTLPRESLFEIQTPQALKTEILKKGLTFAHQRGLDLTDDVSLAEHLGIKPKLVMGSKKFFKITTIDDLDFANYLLIK